MFFLEVSCFFYDPTDVGNLISCSPAFSKSILNIWKFLIYILLKPGLKDFEHYSDECKFWDKRNCVVAWSFYHCILELEWKLTFSSPVATAEFSKFSGILSVSTSTASYFRIWNSSVGILSPPLALFIVMLSKVHLTSHSRMSGSRWVITPSWLSGSWRPFLYSSVYSCHLSYYLQFLLGASCFC